MKTKLSKKLLSAFLAVMMVVTSIPMFAVTSFAAEAVAPDPAITEVENAMKKFEAKLQSQGSFTNVKQAYDAYVACQQALDAYTYGSESDALNGKASALTNAIAQIGTFTAKTGTAVPTFADSPADQMEQFRGVGFNNVLYAPQAEALVAPFDTFGDAYHKVYYSPSITVLYDGVNDAIIPVLVSGQMAASSNGYSKTRYIWSAYPSKENSTKGADDDNWRLVGQWNGGNGTTADWDWNWDQGTVQGVNSHAGWNNANGAQGVYSASLRSVQIRNCNRSWNWTKYDYSMKEELFLANAMKFVGTPTTPGSNYNLYWVVSTGGDNNNDASVTQTGIPIRVVNYKLLTDALATNGAKMKNIAPSEFSEGGLSAYISAMDEATSFDPNTYFANNTNGYDACLTDMNTAISHMNTASTSKKNSTDYKALRDAMSNAVRTVYVGGNVGYTDDSWNDFVAAYENARATMGAVNDGSGYNQATLAATRATALTTAYENLKTNVEKQDTSALVKLIDTFSSYDNIFTTESYNAVLDVINAAKAAVWGSVEDYNIPTAGPDESDEAKTLIDNQIALINNALKGLRINPDAIVAATAGRSSLNEALALEQEAGRTSQYSNWADFATILNEAKAYKNGLATTEFTDYTAQYNAYVAQINRVVAGYRALQISFTELPNGALASSSSQTSISTLSRKDQGEEFVDFSYTPAATIIMTKHEEKTVEFGKADITFGTTIQNKENNMLDSISINATAPALGNNGDQLKIEGTQNSPSSTPKAMTPTQRDDTYKGCLETESGIKINNIRFTSKSNNNSPVRLITLADGTQINDPIQATQTDLTPLLGKTNGEGSDPGKGGVFARTLDDSRADTFMTSDLTVRVPAPETKTLTASTVPEASKITHEGNFGAVLIWNCQNVFNYVGYSYMTTAQNNEKINFNIDVVDATPLFDLVDLCKQIENESYKYTTASWNNFVTALKAAQANMNYGSLSATNITNQCRTRYNNLWAAYQALEFKTFNIAFNYYNVDGVLTTVTVPVTYGQKIDVAQFNATVKPVTYKSADGVMTYTPNGQWTPNLDLDAVVTDEGSYTALYDEALNAADFTAFNTAKAELIGALIDDTFAVDDLQTLATAVEAVSYFEDATHEGVMADKQVDIDAQTAKMVELKAGLTACPLDLSTAQAAQADARVKGGDIDRYDLSGLDFEFTQTVSIAGEDVRGLVFKSQTELDTAIADVLNNIQTKTYTIYLNGNPVVTTEFGTPVIINSDGTYVLNAADTNENYDGAQAAWTYSYNAPSRGNAGVTDAKYMVTAPSFGFIVKGDTYLTSVETEKEAADTFVVTVKSEQTGKTIDVATTTGSYTMPVAPKYANWTFNSYDNGAAEGATITVTENTTILANYDANTRLTYQIDTFASLDDMYNGNVTSNTYNFNDRIDLVNEDAYVWVMGDLDMTGVNKYTLLAYGPEYSFYACQSFIMTDLNLDTLKGKAILPLSEVEYKSFIEGATAYEKPLGSNEYVTSFSEEAYDVLYDGTGNPLFATAVTVRGARVTYTYPAPVATLTSLDKAVPVGENNEKFSLIGTFTLPEGTNIVECGFLFTSNANPGDMIVDRVGMNGIARMKASRYTCGNQFVINIKNPSSTVSFTYCPYAIVKDADGNVSTIYGSVQNASNNF